MPNPSGSIRCDGCGLPGGPEHIAERLQRLELATRYRPIHISMLFVALAPQAAHDFYGAPQDDLLAQRLFEALEVTPEAASVTAESAEAALAEFQHRGYHMIYVSECPVSIEANVLQGAVVIARLAPALILRIQRSYKPQKIVLLGSDLQSLVSVLQSAGVGPLPLAGNGHPLAIPDASDAEAIAHFRDSLATAK
jgi:hypothetical protein